MPALVAGIHVFLFHGIKDVDGRDEPGTPAARKIVVDVIFNEWTFKGIYPCSIF